MREIGGYIVLRCYTRCTHIASYAELLWESQRMIVDKVITEHDLATRIPQWKKKLPWNTRDHLAGDEGSFMFDQQWCTFKAHRDYSWGTAVRGARIKEHGNG